MTRSYYEENYTNDGNGNGNINYNNSNNIYGRYYNNRFRKSTMTDRILDKLIQRANEMYQKTLIKDLRYTHELLNKNVKSRISLLKRIIKSGRKLKVVNNNERNDRFNHSQAKTARITGLSGHKLRSAHILILKINALHKQYEHLGKMIPYKIKRN